jgi:hypothetical protein
MKAKKILLALFLSLFLASSAWAGNIPEFDAVGCDAINFFARTNLPYMVVTWQNDGYYGGIEWKSVFPKGTYSNYEEFWTQAGQLFPDPCWGFDGRSVNDLNSIACQGLMSAMTDAWNQGVYKWRIVLQMKPESDINVNIYDCVLKHNSFDIWEGADQTGRYRAPWGELVFVPTANPTMTVKAIPGPLATPGFTSPLTLDARTLPGLTLVAMEDQLYTSKAHWEEGIVLALPKTGETNTSGQTEYNLKQGDVIEVTVEIPYNNTVDLFYGADNVLLKYIGVIGTWYYGVSCEKPS